MATPGDAKPTYIYKLIPASAPPPEPLPAVLPVSELDQTSGFIHLSTAKQVPNTLKYFFADEPRVYVLRLAYDPLEEKKLVRWEDPTAEVCGPRGGEGMFPHLYNGLKLGKGEVDSVATWERRDGEGWEDVAEQEKDWLIY
ncbi:uncharacterized protein B0H18DRAFT_976094 [Fomitopsis serialis]|uniref:uncharacterized protein n=1 Tax=Fomitopsis serialis TaxID=139415 RepID=UPI0020086936|nr:uncharacterized protein B0H18DRAFT_976094 [Neoantrodia serialis]KAH9935523.1 hypothetical protein B0H18DRAFT_976094 [Neoantrodia serialis]